MTLYQLKLDVPGELGNRTVWESPTPANPHGPCGVIRAHLELHEWRGDCLVKASPVFVITLPALTALREAGVTGVTDEAMTTSIGEPYQYSSSPSPDSLPPLVRLLPMGRVEADSRHPVIRSWSGHDINDSNVGLVVTEKALAILKRLGLTVATIRPIRFEA